MGLEVGEGVGGGVGVDDGAANGVARLIEGVAEWVEEMVGCAVCVWSAVGVCGRGGRARRSLGRIMEQDSLLFVCLWAAKTAALRADVKALVSGLEATASRIKSASKL